MVILAITLGYILGISQTPIQAATPIILDYPIHHTEYVPHYIQVNHTIRELEPIYIEYPVIINNTITETIYQNLTDFPSRAKLLSFIWNDPTDTLEYGERWTCMDYTLRTIKNAEQQGYRIYFLYDTTDSHALCMAYTVKEARYIIWEPQTDRIEWEWTSTRGG